MSPLNITQPLDSIRYMVYNGYYKVMSNIPKMGHLTTPNDSPIEHGYFPLLSNSKMFQEGLLYLPKIGGQARTASGQQFPPYANQLSALRSGYQTATFQFFLKKNEPISKSKPILNIECLFIS